MSVAAEPLWEFKNGCRCYTSQLYLTRGEKEKKKNGKNPDYPENLHFYLLHFLSNATTLQSFNLFMLFNLRKKIHDFVENILILFCKTTVINELIYHLIKNKCVLMLEYRLYTKGILLLSSTTSIIKCYGLSHPPLVYITIITRVGYKK